MARDVLAEVLPLTVPSRGELWRRLQLARAVLAQRPATADTAAVVLSILNGAPIEDLVQEVVRVAG
jgi:hypothetical protein